MIDGIAATLIDNGMPVVVLAAADMGITGEESPGGAGSRRPAEGAAGKRSGSPPGR